MHRLDSGQQLARGTPDALRIVLRLFDRQVANPILHPNQQHIHAAGVLCKCAVPLQQLLDELAVRRDRDLRRDLQLLHPEFQRSAQQISSERRSYDDGANGLPLCGPFLCARPALL